MPKTRNKQSLNSRSVHQKFQWPKGSACLAALGVGGLFGIPWIVPDLWWLSWPAVVLLIAVVDRPMAGSAFRRAWCYGFGAQMVLSYWIAETLHRFAKFPWWVCIGLLMLYSAYVGVRFGLFGALTARFRTRRPSSILVFPVVWVAIEWLWIHVFPWRLGNTQGQWIPFIQIAEFTGVYGVSFVMMGVSASFYHVIRSFPAFSFRRTPAVHGLIAWGGLLVAVLIWGQWRVNSIESELAGQPHMRVALIQPDFNPETRKGSCLNRCRSVTKQISEPVDLVVWPESAVGMYPLALTNFRDPLQGNDKPIRFERPWPDPAAPLLFGGSSSTHLSPPLEPFYNTAFLCDRGENIIGRYHKRTLIPFGEYIPGEQWFPSLRKLSPFPHAFDSDQSPEPLTVPGLAKLGVLICYEDLLPKLARDSALAGADVLVNLTNDMWFGQSTASAEHQQLALFRAVETRRFLLRCTVCGSTSVISPTGQVLQQVPLFKPGSIIADVQLRNDRTFYAAWGDWLGSICTLLCFVFLIYSLYPNRTGKNPAKL